MGIYCSPWLKNTPMMKSKKRCDTKTAHYGFYILEKNEYSQLAYINNNTSYFIYVSSEIQLLLTPMFSTPHVSYQCVLLCGGEGSMRDGMAGGGGGGVLISCRAWP